MLVKEVEGLNRLSTLYLRFDSADLTPDEQIVIEGLRQAKLLGCEEIRISGNPTVFDGIFYKILDTVKELDTQISFDLNLNDMTEDLIQQLRTMDSIYNFAINLNEKFEIGDDISLEGLIGNIVINYNNVGKAKEGIRQLLDKDRLGLVKVITHVYWLDSCQTYLKLIEDLKNLHKKYKGRLYALIPWALLENSNLTLSRTVCEYRSSVGLFLDGTVTVCGVARSKKEPESSLYTSSLEEILEEDSFINSLKRTTKETLTGVCQVCFFKNYCANLCPAMVFNQTGKFNNSFVDCQILYDNGYFPEQYLLK